MWRALFFACGIVLVLTGLECIVVGRFTISREARFPEFFEKMIFEGGASGYPSLGTLSAEVAPPQSIQGYGGVPNQASQFGPSRFSGANFGNDQFFGGNGQTSKFSAGQSGNAPFSLTAYGAAGGQNPLQIESIMKQPKIIRTRDWMPWSLIAAGSIIVLYTKSLGHEGPK